MYCIILYYSTYVDNIYIYIYIYIYIHTYICTYYDNILQCSIICYYYDAGTRRHPFLCVTVSGPVSYMHYVRVCYVMLC